jgi:hypothetical protein
MEVLQREMREDKENDAREVQQFRVADRAERAYLMAKEMADGKKYCAMALVLCLVLTGQAATYFSSSAVGETLNRYLFPEDRPVYPPPEETVLLVDETSSSPGASLSVNSGPPGSSASIERSTRPTGIDTSATTTRMEPSSGLPTSSTMFSTTEDWTANATGHPEYSEK